MRTHPLLNASLAAAFMSVSQGTIADTPSSHPLARSSISLSASKGCEKLMADNCSGSGTRLEWRSSDSGFGTTRIGLEQYGEDISKVLLNKSVNGRVGSAYAYADWGGSIEGTRLTLDQAFKIGDHSQIEIGGFLGQVKAEVSASARAGIAVHPRSFTIPELNYRGYYFPETQVDYKGHRYDAWADVNRKESSADAGLRFATGSGFAVTNNIRAGVSTFGQASLARTSYGAGAALYYSSSTDNRLGTTAGGICNGSPLLSSARFAFAIGACAQKIQADRIMDAKMRQATRLSDRVNAATGRVDGYLDQAREHLPAGTIPPVGTSYTSADAAKFLGLRHDYKEVTPSIVLSAAVRVGDNAAISLTYQHRKHDPRADLAITFGF